MSEELIVRKEIEIAAKPSEVWKVLTKSEFIKQWDELPEDFLTEFISLGTVIEWEGFSKLTVTGFDPENFLKFSLYLPQVELDPSQYDIFYSYTLRSQNSKTIMIVEIGDFSPIPNGEDYYEASLEFAEEGGAKIKKLSESL
ncbi:SRPBCC family protein [Leptospira sarikeiensis]|uniref:SRPBCC domain-containing protein n=1 Tax=Leptospira sarikeiensis TaxID=2484943 RepID=A0A4R9KBN9_9LEPT|nr:SRPBCC domain-containing protein [Leptospira sarikeiensis]TGL63476.1 SRPBCC domain-containing protein [Leptospira sarikeiensis]